MPRSKSDWKQEMKDFGLTLSKVNGGGSLFIGIALQPKTAIPDSRCRED
jgi:hypothetical protein